jgi:hypothetical protein
MSDEKTNEPVIETLADQPRDEKTNEPLYSLWRMYEQIRVYDLHYSTIRTSVSTFFLTFSLGLGSFLISHEQYFLAIIFPTAFLIISIVISLFFVHLMQHCVHKASYLEKEIAQQLIKAYDFQDEFAAQLKKGFVSKNIKNSESFGKLNPFHFRKGIIHIIKEFNSDCELEKINSLKPLNSIIKCIKSIPLIKHIPRIKRVPDDYFSPISLISLIKKYIPLFKSVPDENFMEIGVFTWSVATILYFLIVISISISHWIYFILISISHWIYLILISQM